MVIVLSPVLSLPQVIWDHSETLMENAMQEKAGFGLLVFGMGAVALLLMCIRLWFDMAQVRAVVEEETGMWRNAGRAFKLTFGNFRSLFWVYLRISLLGWVVFAIGVYVWAKMPPARSQWDIPDFGTGRSVRLRDASLAASMRNDLVSATLPRAPDCSFVAGSDRANPQPAADDRAATPDRNSTVAPRPAGCRESLPWACRRGILPSPP